MRHGDVQNLDQAQCQIYQTIDAILGICDQDQQENLQTDEDFSLEFIVLEYEHAFLDLVWLEVEEHVCEAIWLIIDKQCLPTLQLTDCIRNEL